MKKKKKVTTQSLSKREKQKKSFNHNGDPTVQSHTGLGQACGNNGVKGRDGARNESTLFWPLGQSERGF